MHLPLIQLNAIQELMNIGVGRAAGVLNQMLAKPIRLSIPAIKFGKADELVQEPRKIGDAPMASVRLPFQGAFSGSAFLVFPCEHSQQLVTMVIGEQGDSESLNMLKEATFTEIGNIVINGVMGSLTNILKKQIQYSVPSYAETSFSHILQLNNFDQVEYLLWAEARLTIEDFNALGDILLMFGIQDLELLRDAVDALVEALPERPHFSSLDSPFALLDHFPHGVCIVDGHLTVRAWNRCLEEWTAIHREQIVGESLVQFFPQLGNPKYVLRLESVIGSGLPIIFASQFHPQFIPCVLPDGHQRIQHTVATAIPSEDGNGWWAMLAIQDVTALHRQVQVSQSLWRKSVQESATRRQVEHDLQKQNQELVRINSELDDFAFIASHDLKEPLRGIYSCTQLLLVEQGSKLDAEGTRRCQSVLRLSRRMEALVDSLLEYSRLGRSPLQGGYIDVEKILGEILEDLDSRLKELAIFLRADRVFPTVWGDSVLVGEVFHNLLTNAMKYNDKVEKWVEIGWEDCDYGPEKTTGQSPEMIRFFVRDNGIGIREKHFVSVYKIFKKLHGSGRFEGGTGIGLTIVKKLVERLGGNVWVDSTYGEGTTFSFTLPKGPSVYA